jgi:5-methyltetrahydropteroyltriglutamate--homocysteine methyltransferase
MAKASILGFPRIGKNRELKTAVESFWKGESSFKDLEEKAKIIRKNNWQMQVDAGMSTLPVNDFSYYDHILDTCITFNIIPSRFKSLVNDPAKLYFACARGLQEGNLDLQAMEMTKWFDTNYHYIVPELEIDQVFALNFDKIEREVLEAKQFNRELKLVLVGPVTLLLLSKIRSGMISANSFFNKIIPLYLRLFDLVAKHGVKIIQMDEPILATDLKSSEKEAFIAAYEMIDKDNFKQKIILTSYFGEVSENISIISELPVSGFHFDLVRGERDVDAIITNIAKNKYISRFIPKYLSLGLVDGRNIWINDFTKSAQIIDKFLMALPSYTMFISSSCSLLHCPVDLDSEKKIDSEIRPWLAFAKQKMEEIKILVDYANKNDVSEAFSNNRRALIDRKSSKKVHNANVKERVARINESLLNRKSPFAKRIEKQVRALNLPLFPITTIGSFPQTADVRKARAKFKKGELSATEYNQFIEHLTVDAIRRQENIGIDVLVHGEFERNDMVEYFGEQLEGFIFTEYGWVQGYGSRCVKPPIIFGDVSRPHPMTVDWIGFAQKQTKKIMKGMLTGPITILQWSFVRDDQPRETTCKQIALAIRDEVVDLEKAGIKIIQIDEPAIREGLPLLQKDKKAYLKWAVDSFRISASGVQDETQIHTHMCYSEFNDIIDSIANMDADVVSIETSRSNMELLDAFEKFKYPNQIGPGVYDIHSPRIPTKQEMVDLLKRATKLLSKDQIWVNPDCGLKTRNWKEVEASLLNMVAATEEMRKREQGKKSGWF